VKLAEITNEIIRTNAPKKVKKISKVKRKKETNATTITAR